MSNSNRILSRKQFLTLGTLSAGALLLPKIAYAEEPFSSNTIRDPYGNNPNFYASLASKEGELLASTKDNMKSYLKNNLFNLAEKHDYFENPDGSITASYQVDVFAPYNTRAGSYDDQPAAFISYDITYYITSGNICITKGTGTAYPKQSYATMGTRTLVIHQGIAGMDKHHYEALFNSNSYTHATGWGPCHTFRVPPRTEWSAMEANALQI